MATKSILKGEKRKKTVKISMMISFLFIGVVGYRIYWAFFDLNRSPTGEYLTEEMSPDGTYTLKNYVSGTSLSSDAVRGELVYNKRNGKTKNI